MARSRERARRHALPALVAIATPALAARAALAATPAERPVRVTIQAQPRFEGARATLAEPDRDDAAGDAPDEVGASIEVEAQLVSDTGVALVGADVGFALANPERGASLRPCTSPSRGARAEGSLRSDEGGRLCVRVSGASFDNGLRLTFAGDALHLPSTAEIALHPAPTLATLAFDTPSLELDLDQAKLELRLTYSVTPHSAAQLGEALPDIEVSLHDGGRSLRLTTYDWRRDGGSLWFGIDTNQLGAPGPARLVAQIAPHAGAVGSPARAEAIALRVATVRLGAEPSIDEGGVHLLRVWTETLVPGATPTGWVEASQGAEGEMVASAPLVQGNARLDLGLSPPSGEFGINYHSDDPWWRAGPPLLLSLDAGAARSPRRWPWLALLAPIGYVCLRSLQRPAQPKAQRRRLPEPRPREIVAEVPMPVSGWVGMVSDAHDGQPIAGAEVQALLPSFRGSEPRAHSAVTDPRGWFALPGLDGPVTEGARLRVWAPLHSEVERPLPPQGRVSIALTSRRRAVLRRLVRWATTLGSPWARSGDPTPGEIAEIAARRGDARTARWAEGVQAAAFGRAPVDEAVETALRTAEPGWHQGAPRGESSED